MYFFFWISAVHHPFPRNQIVYLKELGVGWFGKVIFHIIVIAVVTIVESL
jgi:hypothetical protein